MPDDDDEPQTLGQQIIDWIERHCFVPEGALVGQPLELMEWQKREILRIYDNPAGTRRAIISVGRKSGKTCLAACLLLVHLASSAALPNSQLYSAAQSRDQAALLYGLAAKIVRMSPRLSATIVAKDGVKQLVCPAWGTSYRALSSEAGTAYGLSPAFVCHDELGVVRGPRSELFEVLETATGGQIAPLSVVISTQSESDSDLLSVLIDDALSGRDPRIVCALYTAPLDADPFSIETIKLANSRVGQFPKSGRSLTDGARCEGDAVSPRCLPPTRAQSAHRSVSAVRPGGGMASLRWHAARSNGGRRGGWPRSFRNARFNLSIPNRPRLLDGSWSVQPTFFLPSEGLHDKARVDKIPYDQWRDEGYLETTPESMVSYEYVARYLRDVFEHHHGRKITFDRWNTQHLTPWLLNAGFSEQLIKDKFVPFGQGQSMSPALRDLENVILEKKLRHGGHPLLQMCASNAVIERDGAGNRKLSKKRATGRIDGMVALLMAFGVAPLRTAAKFDVEALIA